MLNDDISVNFMRFATYLQSTQSAERHTVKGYNSSLQLIPARHCIGTLEYWPTMPCHDLSGGGCMSTISIRQQLELTAIRS
jgi:hypothetical protein